jgi:predicted Rossmann fold nucleotide-binding protein DprA/Smf involved in DNA uptake
LLWRRRVTGIETVIATIHAQAVLLLTARFAAPEKADERPLSAGEWGRFASWLKDCNLLPEALLERDPADVLAQWHDGAITIPRIRALLGRAAALGLAMEKWERAGLWVLTRSDPIYPSRLKRLLKTGSPPLLFGCGNAALLNRGGLAVVGSRNADEADLAYAAQLGRLAAAQGRSIVSGAARGVDEAAMLGALEGEGTVIGVLADSLLRTAMSARYRHGLKSGNVVLVSPFYPEAGFNVGNAMGRNKYIYCLADAAVVVTSASGSGGTWSGAIENMRQGWVPLWVRSTADAASGNMVRAGRGFI